MQQTSTSTDERSLGELFSDMSRELGTLVQREAELAKTEITAKVSQLTQSVASIAVGGAVLYAGFLTILAAIVFALATAGLPAWLAALIVGAIVIGVGWFLLKRGLDTIKRTDLAPSQTVQTMKDNVQWAKEQTK